MNVLKRSLTFSLLIVRMYCYAQNFQFSQYNFTTTRVNPAWIGLTNFATVDFDYRNQKTGGDFAINSNYFAVAYPLLRQSTGTPWAGVGISILDDRSGGIFKTQEAALSYAINVSTGKYEVLSLGFRGLLRTQQIDFSGLSTGAQYIEGRGFDPSVSNGENVSNLKISYPTFSTGILWQKNDRRKNLMKQIDAAIFDFNNPNNSFTGSDSRLAPSFVTHAAFLLNRQSQLNTYTDILFSYGAGTSTLNFGARWQYDLTPTSRALSDHIDFITRYVVGRSGIVGVQFFNEKISFGLSYDFPVIIKNYGNTGAFEIGLGYRTPVHPKDRRKNKKPIAKRPPTKVNSVKKPPAKPPVIKKDSVTVKINDKPIEEPSPSVLIVKPDSANSKHEAKAGKIKHEPLLIEKITLHFHFDFNSIDLDDETETFLKELSISLNENPNLRLKIAGHTDNRGSVKYNQHLSLQRANEIKKYLTKLGVDASRIVTEGKGLTEPLNNNSTDEERAKNRRVEINMYDEE